MNYPDWLTKASLAVVKEAGQYFNDQALFDQATLEWAYYHCKHDGYRMTQKGWRPTKISWAELEEIYPGCGAAWDLFMSVLSAPVEPIFEFEWQFDNEVPCEFSAYTAYGHHTSKPCKNGCWRSGNTLRLMARIFIADGESFNYRDDSTVIYSSTVQRWGFK